MAVESGSLVTKWETRFLGVLNRYPQRRLRITHNDTIIHFNIHSIASDNIKSNATTTITSSKNRKLCVLMAVDRNNGNGDVNNSNNNSSKKSSSAAAAVQNSNYVVPLDKSSTSSSCITRPLAEILRDLNKRIPGNIIIKPSHDDHHHSTFISWYHANRMLSFYAPGWCGEIRDVIFSDNGSVTVVYRVTIRGSDGEAHRESTGTISSGNGDIVDPVAAAEEIAFCRACARFGLGLYLYHEE